MVTDNQQLIQPFKDILLKVELVVDMSMRQYNKTYFYRWLEDIQVSALQSICWELEDCCDQAMELLNTYVVSGIKPMFSTACWQVDTRFTGNLPLIASVVREWVQYPVSRMSHDLELFS